MPFLVDSVTMALAEQGIGVYVLGHPVVPITRDRAGKLLEVGEGNPESLMHMEIDRLTGDAIDTVRTTLQGVLAEVRGIVADWGAMREKMRSEEHTSELQSLMRISYAVFCLKKKIL